MSTRLPPTAPNERTSLLDKLSGLKHGSLLFTNCYIFHLKQIFAQKRIVPGLNGLSDINRAVSDSGQGSRPQSERPLCSVKKKKKKKEKGERDIETSMKYLTFLVSRRIRKYFESTDCDTVMGWLKSLPTAIIFHIPQCLHGLSISGLDSGNKDSH